MCLGVSGRLLGCWLLKVVGAGGCVFEFVHVEWCRCLNRGWCQVVGMVWFVSDLQWLQHIALPASLQHSHQHRSLLEGVLQRHHALLCMGVDQALVYVLQKVHSPGMQHACAYQAENAELGYWLGKER